MKQQIDINQVADYFIAKAHSFGDDLTNLKIQKILYYAQAWHLALEDKELFDADFEAWVHGPVNVEIYQRFKHLQHRPILDDIAQPKLPKETKVFLDKIWEVFGVESAFTLARMTHNEDPWKEARKGIPDDEPCHNIISRDTMKNYYKSLSQK